MNFLAVTNILRSNIKYLLITTYPDGQNRSIRSDDWFTLNLNAAPYNFPPPIRVLDDWAPPFDRRELALWEIESLGHALGDAVRPESHYRFQRHESMRPACWSPFPWNAVFRRSIEARTATDASRVPWPTLDDTPILHAELAK